MKKATQRVLSLLLAAVLLFGMLPVSAFAAETEQTGIAAAEVDVTDPPEMAESEPVESIGNDTIPTEATQVETETMETTAPTTEQEVTHSDDTQPVAYCFCGAFLFFLWFFGLLLWTFVLL